VLLSSHLAMQTKLFFARRPEWLSVDAVLIGKLSAARVAGLMSHFGGTQTLVKGNSVSRSNRGDRVEMSAWLWGVDLWRQDY
jgi:hypothetical protein